MRKTIILGAFLLLAAVPTARAEEEAAVEPHLFDDFNANGVSDSIDAEQANGNEAPSREVDDADQSDNTRGLETEATTNG